MIVTEIMFVLCPNTAGHPTQTFWTPKYGSIEGYAHPIWEYLYRMSFISTNYDGMEISDALIHYCVTQTSETARPRKTMAVGII